MELDEARLDRLAGYIRDLPDRVRYEREELLTPALHLTSDGPLQMYYAPLDVVTAGAKIAIIGITPGWVQMEIAVRTARAALRAGHARADAYQLAKQQASFAGPMRQNLVAQLDELGLPAYFGLSSSSELFTSSLLHTTSAVRYPVFYHGQNYTGARPPATKSVMLMSVARQLLASELALVPEAVLVPLGESVDAVLTALEAEGRLAPGRRLTGFPHPSGANGHRARRFAERRNSLRETLRKCLT